MYRLLCRTDGSLQIPNKYAKLSILLFSGVIGFQRIAFGKDTTIYKKLAEPCSEKEKGYQQADNIKYTQCLPGNSVDS